MEIFCSKEVKVKEIFTILIGLFCVVSQINGQVPLNPDPIWSYGCDAPRDNAFCDINNDGYLDLSIVQESEVNYIFMNINGTLESSPSWQSSDADFSIACAFGDVDNDGDSDLAVGNYSFAGGRVTLYENQAGGLNPIPAWAADYMGACWVGWGDVDSDGDVDLAAADLYSYPCVFTNNNGTLETTPSWVASDYNLDFAGAWIDFDNDGDLDLSIGNVNGSIPLVRIYENTDGSLERAASWTSILPNAELGAAEGITAGDIDADGWLDLAITNDMNDAKKNFGFINMGGYFDTIPSWISTDSYRSIRCALGDVDGDGDMDFATASGPYYYATVYLNNGAIFSSSPDWFSNTRAEWGVSFGDVDNDGVAQMVDTLYGNDTLNLFYLSHYPVHSLDTIKVDGIPLPSSDYCYGREFGWISLKNAPAAGSIVSIYYLYSIDMELAAGGIYLFQNGTVGVKGKEKPLTLDQPRLNLFPNPAFDRVTISYNIQKDMHVSLRIYDVSGHLIKTLVNGYRGDGLGCVQWNLIDNSNKRVPNGVYYAHLRIGDARKCAKLIVMR
jgi:hypothetical protein